MLPRADLNRVPGTVFTRSLDSCSLRDDLGPGAFEAAVDAIPRPATGSPGAVGHCSRAPHLDLGQEGRVRPGSGRVQVGQEDCSGKGQALPAGHWGGREKTSGQKAVEVGDQIAKGPRATFQSQTGS